MEIISQENNPISPDQNFYDLLSQDPISSWADEEVEEEAETPKKEGNSEFALHEGENQDAKGDDDRATVSNTDVPETDTFFTQEDVKENESQYVEDWKQVPTRKSKRKGELNKEPSPTTEEQCDLGSVGLSFFIDITAGPFQRLVETFKNKSSDDGRDGWAKMLAIQNIVTSNSADSIVEKVLVVGDIPPPSPRYKGWDVIEGNVKKVCNMTCKIEGFNPRKNPINGETIGGSDSEMINRTIISRALSHLKAPNRNGDKRKHRAIFYTDTIRLVRAITKPKNDRHNIEVFTSNEDVGVLIKILCEKYPENFMCHYLNCQRFGGR
jgi:hypothetical protein